MNNRVVREMDAYDHKLLKTEKYSSVFKHTSSYYFDYRISVVKDILKDIENKNVLELGSQSWKSLLTKNDLIPKKLTCINISQAELDNGIRLGNESNLQINFEIMDANDLAFSDNSFDIVFGGAILHHLDFTKALNEVYRVLKPGGEILFIEPLGINPVSKIIRILTPFARTKDEKPLGFSEISQVKRLFKTNLYFEQFTTVPFGVISGLISKNPKNILTKSAYNLDRFLDRNAPIIRPFFRNIILHGKKRLNDN